MNKPKPKPITKKERQARIKANVEKLNNHINEGVDSCVREAYLEGKKARKNARWYQAGEALVEAKLQAKLDADQEFAEEFTAWAEKQQEDYYAELDASEEQMLLAEDVIDVEFKPIAPKRRERKSLLGSSQSNLLIGSSNSNTEEEAKPNTTNPYMSNKRPK